MRRTITNPRIVPSVLDRLFDDAPDERTEPLADFRHGLARLKRSVARDLENLLNTRASSVSNLDAFPELNKSVLTYGLPDYSNLSAASETDRNRIRASIEQTISLFEPRLEKTRVALRTSEASAAQFAFHIEAMLRVDPIPEPVIFDAVLEVSTQLYKIN
ncbi:MAG TPA: type VI secretion system baseplate subunit TssE [Rhodocyclaceae bacterium]|nr:type VI secretion system baseplate subunit TssE [Rhodocyclaceae bacterium]